METTELSPGRAFCVFVFAGAGFGLLGFLVRGFWDVFWIDLVRHNPYRSVSHALVAMLIMSLIAGIWIIVGRLSGALLFAGCMAAASARILGRVPLWFAAHLVLLCGFIIHAQEIVWPSYRSFMDDPNNEISPLIVTLWMSAHLTPGIIGAWWLLWRADNSRAPRPERI